MRRCFLSLLLLPLSAFAQQTTPTLEPLPSGLARLQGHDAASGIDYTRLFLTTAPPPPAPTAGGAPVPLPSPDLTLPTLAAQCTRTPAGKLKFDLFVNFGNVTDTAFYPPWHYTPEDRYPPNYEKITLTMEFLGYTKVKPVKHQFERLPQPSAQLHYNTPGLGSSNLEEITFYFRYLRALPTLHISSPTQTATFQTEPLLAQIRKEPLCLVPGI